MPIEIKQATVADVEAIVPLYLGYCAFYETAVTATAVKKYVRARLEKGESVIYLAYLQEEPVGFTQLYPTFASLALAPAWILYDLFVTPAARRQGVGRALMTRARTLAQKSGASYITLETAVDNHSAQALYEQMGYEREQEFYAYHLSLNEETG